MALPFPSDPPLRAGFLLGKPASEGWRAALLLLLSLLAANLAGCGQEDSPPAAGERMPVAEAPVHDPSRRYLAQIREHSEEEFRSILQRAEAVITESAEYPQFEPIEFVLHGGEAAFFVRDNYPRYRDIVDLAARLDAFGVIDIKICEGWMKLRGVVPEDLPAFVETVPYGPAVEQQLQREGYVYF